MENNSEKILLEAWRLKEEGKTWPEILNLYPESAEEIKEIFSTADILTREAEKINPEPVALRAVVEKISAAEIVTNKSRVRNINQEAVKGRALQNIASSFRYLMSLTWKTIVPVSLVIVLGAAVGVYQFGVKPARDTANQTDYEFVSDDINEALNSLDQDADGLESAFDEDADITVVDSDSQALNAFDNINNVYEL
ncbi:MAG: hypothetical protein PHD72_04120 [Patescibacteria group bacterium]|nr:hypothetical protein [Patescibacteria group bacterium]